MSQTRANLLMLIASFIWGTAFVSQTTGMGTIGPFTFSFSRFFFATIAVLPIALYFEANNFLKIFFNSKLLKLTLIFFPITSELLLKKGKINKGKLILLKVIFSKFSKFLI